MKYAVGLYTNESPTRKSAMNGACVRVCGIVLIFVNTNLIHFNAKSIPVELSSRRQEFSRHFKLRLCCCASSQLRLVPILHSHQTLSESRLTFLLWEKNISQLSSDKLHPKRQRILCGQSWVLHQDLYLPGLWAYFLLSRLNFLNKLDACTPWAQPLSCQIWLSKPFTMFISLWLTPTWARCV